MANEILIRFKTQSLDRAKQLAKDIAASVKESAKGIKDAVERRAFLAEARAAAKERKEELGAASTRLGLEKRAANLRDASQAQIDRSVEKALKNAQRAQGAATKLSGVVGMVAGLGDKDPLGAGLAAASLVGGPVGSAVAAAGALVGWFTGYVDREFDKMVAKRWAEWDRRFEQAMRDLDLEARYQEDSVFRGRINAEATAIYVARRDAGWEPRGRAFLHGDD